MSELVPPLKAETKNLDFRLVEKACLARGIFEMGLGK